MQKLMDNIISYLDYLKEELHLCVSVHFSDRKLRVFPQELFSRLLPYNIHENPYCCLVKRDHWETCIREQQDILQQPLCGGVCRSCHAGVREYLFQITDGEQVAGYVAVSGYLGDNPKYPEAALTHLRSDVPPEGFPEAVIPPLCRMFELLFTYPMEDVQGEFHLMLQFLHECHGQVTLDELCRHFTRSKSYVSHLFNEKCGTSLPAYCNDLKLEYSRILLGRSDLPVTAVAMDAGFNDVSYFIQKFKDKYGMTPLRYRKTNIERLLRKRDIL